MLLEVFLGGRNHLQGNELVSSLLEAADDVADESALDTIWLDSDEAEMEVSRPLNRTLFACTLHSRLLGRHSGC